jgi:hypothetical protein
MKKLLAAMTSVLIGVSSLLVPGMRGKLVLRMAQGGALAVGLVLTQGAVAEASGIHITGAVTE